MSETPTPEPNQAPILPTKRGIQIDVERTRRGKNPLPPGMSMQEYLDMMRQLWLEAPTHPDL